MNRNIKNKLPITQKELDVFKDIISYSAVSLKNIENKNIVDATYLVICRLYTIFIDSKRMRELEILKKLIYSYPIYSNHISNIMFFICWKYNLITLPEESEKYMKKKHNFSEKAIIKTCTATLQEKEDVFLYLTRGLANLKTADYSNAYADFISAKQKAIAENNASIVKYCEILTQITEEKIAVQTNDSKN